MENREITYRTVLPKDISIIMQIERSTFSNFICEDESVFLERIKIFPEGFILLEVKGIPIGYICSEIWNRSDVIDKKQFELGHSIGKQHISKGNELYISSMGIMPEHQGKGFGKRLFEDFLKYIADKFNHIGSIILVVSENWTTARKIYVSNEFKEIKVLKGFFPCTSSDHYLKNGIVMRKKFCKNPRI